MKKSWAQTNWTRRVFYEGEDFGFKIWSTYGQNMIKTWSTYDQNMVKILWKYSETYWVVMVWHRSQLVDRRNCQNCAMVTRCCANARESRTESTSAACSGAWIAASGLGSASAQRRTAPRCGGGQCLRWQCFQQNDPWFLKSKELPCSAASGGIFP